MIILRAGGREREKRLIFRAFVNVALRVLRLNWDHILGVFLFSDEEYGKTSTFVVKPICLKVLLNAYNNVMDSDKMRQ